MDPNNRDFLELVRETEAAVTALLSALGASLVAIILGGHIRRRQQTLIDRAIRDYVEGYEVVVTDAVATAGALQAAKNDKTLIPILVRAGAQAEAEFMRDRFQGYREIIRRRFPTQRHPEDLRTFEQRVTTVRQGFQRLVYRMVQTGVDEGTDPRKLAFQIRDAVIMTPKGAPSESFKEAARLRNRASTFVARGAPSGSVQYNSMRIVRTEMASIYRTSVYDFYDDRPYLEGYDWKLSNRHKKADRCDLNASGSPYKARGDVPPTHPMCLCRVVARVTSQAALKQLIASGTLS